ncbi:MAG: GHKL domain-containing protein [Lachnospiraceae bacterium]|nr:GHKL domain-containing protein [Lachnospiraceae bacterium]
MNDALYMNIIQTILSFALDYYIIKTYIQHIFKGTSPKCRIIYFYISIFVVEIILLISTALIADYRSTVSTFIMTFISIITTIGLAFFYCNRIKSAVFVAFSFQIMIAISEFLVYLIAIHFIFNGGSDIAEFNQQSFQISMDLFSKLTLLIFVMVFTFIWKKEYNSFSFEHSFLLFFTPVLSSIILVIIPVDDAYIRQEPLFYCSIWIFIALINIVNTTLLNKIEENNTSKIINIQLNKQLEYQKEKYSQMSETYKTGRRIIHDIKHHCSALKRAIQSEQYDSLNEYLGAFVSDLEDTYVKYNTGNLVIDSFITNYYNIATANKIEFVAHLDVDYRRIPLSEYDLSIVLGNLLDNCLNACMNQSLPNRNINIKIITSTDDRFIIITDNTYCIEQNKTDVDTALLHGYGSKNIEAVVNNYNGIIVVNPGDTYKVTIIIPIIDTKSRLT